jgi:hypothetical protein
MGIVLRSVGIPAGIDLKPSATAFPGYPKSECSIFILICVNAR